MTPPSQQVFISYQREDADFARHVREQLAAREVKTWMDQYDIPIGAYWPDEIDKGLASSDIVVGILSPAAVESRNVKNEWDWALQNDKRLLLLQYRACIIPHRYVSINFIDASGPGLDAAIDLLLHALHPGDVPASDPERTTLPLRPRHNPSRAPCSPRRHEPFLVGREREQEQLRVIIDDLLAGRGGIVLLSGEAGIGKTTLTHWFAWLAESRSVLVVSGGCYDLTTPPPYGPWARITSNWPADPLSPPMPDVLREGTGMGDVRNQQEFFAVFERFLTDTSLVHPLLLLLEDFHWVDQDSLALLCVLARTVASRRLLLVLTFRDDELRRGHPLAQALPTLVREESTYRLPLARLTPKATEDLVQRYTLSASDKAALADYVYRLAEGNPFFSGEIMRALEEAGAICQEDGHWHVTNLERVQVPALVRQVIESRLGRLGDERVHLLQVAAVIGHEIPVDLWVTVSGADEDVLSDTLERAAEARVVEELPGGASFRFTHALIRETLYESLVSLRRRRWHRAVATALLTARRPDPYTIAYHFQQAGDERAYEWLTRAARRAMDSLAWRTAVERWEEAATQLDGDDERQRELGWVLFVCGSLLRYVNPSRAFDAFYDARRIGQDVGDVFLVACARAGIGFQTLNAGDTPRAIEELDFAVDVFDQLGRAALDTLPPSVDATYIEHVIEDRRSIRPMALTAIGRYLDALYLCDQLVVRAAEADSAGRYNGLGNVYLAQLVLFALLGRPEDATEAYRQASTYFQTVEVSPYVLGIAAFFYLHTVALPYFADHPQVIDTTARVGTDAWIAARGTATEGRSPRVAELGLLELRGEWDDAVDVATTAVAEEIILWFRDEAARVLGTLARHRGEPDRAWDEVARYFPDGPAPPDGTRHYMVSAAMQRLAAALAVDAGDLVLARRWLELHDDWMTWSGSVMGQLEGHLGWARYHWKSGDLPSAEEHARAALAKADTPRQPLGLIASHRLLGELAIERHEYDRADDHLSNSLTLAEACQAPFERALTLVALAELAVATNSREDALGFLSQASSIGEPLQARPLLERIEGLRVTLAAR